LTRAPRDTYSALDPLNSAMDNDLAALEQRLSTLLAHTRSLRVANETLRNELAQMQARNRELALRVQAATARLDALLARIPTQ